MKDSEGNPEDGGHTEQQNESENFQCSSNEEQLLELPDGSKVKILIAACLDKVHEDQMPVVANLVGETPMEELRDTGCSGVIVKKALVKEQQLIEAVGYIMTIDRKVLKVPIAIIDIATPYFAGRTEAMSMSDPMYELIVGNILGASATNDVNKERCAPAAAVTRSKRCGVGPCWSRVRLANSQCQRSSLCSFKKRMNLWTSLKIPMRPLFGNDTRVYIKRREDCGIESNNEKTNLILVLKKLKRKVMKLAHDFVLGGQMGIKKTEDRILSNFF